MQSLSEQISKLQTYIPNFDTVNPAVSNVSVGWHIDHCLLVCKVIVEAVSQSDPALYKPSYKFSKLLVYTLKKIPRGRGKAPKAVLPENNIVPAALHLHVQKALNKTNTLAQLKPNNYFEHPYFGKLNVKETETFLAIHTNHHLKIIKDILQN